MAEAKKLTQKEYEAIRADYEKRYGYDSRSYSILNLKLRDEDYEKRYGYDSRSPEEKAAFDKKFDEHYQTDKKSDATDDDPTEPNEDINKGHERERERGGRGFREIDDDDER